MSEKTIWYEIEEKHPRWGWRRMVGASDTLTKAREKALGIIGETRIVEMTQTRRIIPTPSPTTTGEQK